MTPMHHVWVAMANLFLESSVPLWYPLVAGEHAESPFSMTELETKLKEEVAPAMWLGTERAGPAGFEDSVVNVI